MGIGNKYGNGAKQIVSSAWEMIKGVVESVVTFIVDLVTASGTTIIRNSAIYMGTELYQFFLQLEVGYMRM